MGFTISQIPEDGPSKVGQRDSDGQRWQSGSLQGLLENLSRRVAFFEVQSQAHRKFFSSPLKQTCFLRVPMVSLTCVSYTCHF